MKNKFLILLLLYILFIPTINAYSNKVTYTDIESVFDNFRTRLIEPSEYLFYEAEKVKMTLLSESEYLQNSYLDNGKETWLSSGTKYINTKGNIENSQEGSSHYLKGIVYVGSDKEVIGSGSKSRPYKFTNSYDLYISKIYVKNANGKDEDIMEKLSGSQTVTDYLSSTTYELYHYDCNNRAVVTWENNELLFSNIMVPVSCRLWFE